MQLRTVDFIANAKKNPNRGGVFLVVSEPMPLRCYINLGNNSSNKAYNPKEVWVVYLLSLVIAVLCWLTKLMTSFLLYWAMDWV